MVAIARGHGFDLEKPRVVNDRLDRLGWYRYNLLVADERRIVIACSLDKAFIPFSSIPPRNVVVVEYKEGDKTGSVRKIVWSRAV
uniref:Uncharacterized protein n=1 Tax=Ignisphaera aggregans TaxID=334771 RepID=A0A7J2TAZ9_9CREN